MQNLCVPVSFVENDCIFISFTVLVSSIRLAIEDALMLAGNTKQSDYIRGKAWTNLKKRKSLRYTENLVMERRAGSSRTAHAHEHRLGCDPERFPVARTLDLPEHRDLRPDAAARGECSGRSLRSPRR